MRALVIFLLVGLAHAHGGSFAPPRPPPPPAPPPPPRPNTPGDRTRPPPSEPPPPPETPTDPEPPPPAPPTPTPEPDGPATPEEPGQPVPPGTTLPPGTRTPSDTPPPPAPPTPPDGPGAPHPPPGPTTPPPTPAPETPNGGAPRLPTDRPRRKTATDSANWSYWWYFNREHLLGFRRNMVASGPVSGTKIDGPDPIEVARDEVLVVLRRIATSPGEPSLRASALIAIGRAGRGEDAELFVRVLREKGVDPGVQEGAALGLGLLPPIEDAKRRGLVREHLQYYLRKPDALPTRARAFAAIATGLRARNDRMLVMHLASELAAPRDQRDRYSALLLAGGLSGDRMLAPEIIEAARRGRIGRARKLDDVLQAHAVNALGHLGDAVAVPTLTAILRSRRSRIESRRAAALALGRLLRETQLSDPDRNKATEALARVLGKSGDSTLRGFAAIALGGARPPAEIDELRRVLDRGGDVGLRPYAAIALGLAARSTRTTQGGSIASFLADELEKTNNHDLHGALCIAVGLARSREAHEALVDRLAQESLPSDIRGYAAQAIALFGRQTPSANEALRKVIEKGPNELIGDASLALGMLGRRSVALDLVKQLDAARSRTTQARIVLALGNLAHTATMKPLLEIVARRDRTELREYAIVALGLMFDPRKRDELFSIDADFNFYGTTDSTNELLRLY